MTGPYSDRENGQTNDVINLKQDDTLWSLFCERVHRTPYGVAYRDYDFVTKSWRDHSWRTISTRVDRFRTALAREELKPGDRVGILLPNSVDWVCLDLAAHALGFVVVALYPHDSAASNAYILGHSDARLVLLDSSARWRALDAYCADLPMLTRVWIRDGPGENMQALTSVVVRSLAAVLAEVQDVPPTHPVTPTTLATLIYTSGTTGRPKGVMLSHYALLWNAAASARIIPPHLDDVFLSILPLAHAFERTVGHYLAMIGGSTVAYARSPQDLRDDLMMIRPTILLGVPRLFERMYAAIHLRTEASTVQQYLMRLTASLGWRRFEAGQKRGRGLGFCARLIWPLLERLVAVPVLAAFGGRLRVAVSGGAPLDEIIARFLIGIGLPLVEGYGLTETGPVVATNALDNNLPGSVGEALNGISVRLTEESELLVHSPSIMMGYWKDGIQTSRVLDKSGWLTTGDVAEIRDGRIFIRSRVNEMIVLSIGEKINPNVVESEITRDKLIEQVVVVGSSRPFLAALIVLNSAEWEKFAHEIGADVDQPNTQSVKKIMLARLEKRLVNFPRHAQIRAVHLSLEPWSINAGLLTPTLKVKRDTLQRRFAAEIAAMFDQVAELLEIEGENQVRMRT